MKFESVRYSVEMQNEWDSFVKESANGGLFQEQRFLSYHPKERFNDCSLMFYDKKKNLQAVFPAAIISKDNHRILKSHPGSSYGGLIVKSKFGIERSLALVDDLLEFAKSENIDRIEFRQSESIFYSDLCDEIEYALWKNGFERSAIELSTCIELANFFGEDDDEIIRSSKLNFARMRRRNIIDAIEFGLDFKELSTEENWNEYYQILCKNLEKHKATPTHQLSEMLKLKDLYPERIKLYGANLGEEIVSGAFVFEVLPKRFHLFYASMDYAKSEYKPLAFIIFKLLRHLANEGGEILNYGISTEDGGKYANISLFQFKESFSGKGINRYYWQREL